MLTTINNMTIDVGNIYYTDWIRYELADYLNISFEKVYFFWDRHRAPSQDEEYIVIQLESLSVPGKLDNNYKKLINNATVIYEFTEKNILYYSKYFSAEVLKRVKLLHYNPSLDSTYNNTVDKTIDVLFYGTMSSRREKIINKIKEKNPHWNVLISTSSTNSFTKNVLIDHISKSKWVLSVGSWPNAPSDSLRTTPALNFGGNLLMEEFTDSIYMDYLKSKFSHRIKFLEKEYFNE